MLRLYADIRNEQIRDALYIWKKMKEGDFYVFTCANLPVAGVDGTPPPTALTTEVINLNTLVRTIRLLKRRVNIDSAPGGRKSLGWCGGCGSIRRYR